MRSDFHLVFGADWILWLKSQLQNGVCQPAWPCSFRLSLLRGRLRCLLRDRLRLIPSGPQINSCAAAFIVAESPSIVHEVYNWGAGKSRDRSVTELPGFLSALVIRRICAWLDSRDSDRGGCSSEKMQIASRFLTKWRVSSTFSVPESLLIFHPCQFKCAFQNNGQQDIERLQRQISWRSD